MTADEIIKDIKHGKQKPVYLLHGEEPYFIDKISNYIEHHLLTDAEKGFNQTVVYGKDTDVVTILNAAKRYPMMANFQVVIVKEAQDMKWGKEDDDKKGINPFLAYLEKPLPSTILVFAYKHGKFDKRKKVYKAIVKTGLIFESAPLYDNKLPAWIEGYAAGKKYRIHSQAAAMLAEYLGNDLQKIANELDKLALNIPPGKEITLKEVQDNIGISKEYNVFELQAALTRRDALKANQIINYFEANPKANPIVLILSNLYNFFSKVLLFHYIKSKTAQDAAREMGVNPYFMKDYEQASRTYDQWKLMDIIDYLKEYDLKSKGVESSASPGELLKELIFKIIH